MIAKPGILKSREEVQFSVSDTVSQQCSIMSTWCVPLSPIVIHSIQGGFSRILFSIGAYILSLSLPLSLFNIGVIVCWIDFDVKRKSETESRTKWKRQMLNSLTHWHINLHPPSIACFLCALIEEPIRQFSPPFFSLSPSLDVFV